MLDILCLLLTIKKGVINMNKFKKIGLTALAGSLVATSAFAGALTATGAASMGLANTTGSYDPGTGKAFSMGNQITIAGSGELDNGMTVSLSFQLDSGYDTGTGTGPFDDHAVTVSSDALGTLVFSGHGGSSAQSALDSTAAGNIWNTTLGLSGSLATAASGDNSLFYTLPEMTEGLAITASMSPGNGATQNTHGSFGLVYTGVDGLKVSYAQGDSGAVGSEIESTSMFASYAIGSITVAVSNTDNDKTGASNRELNSYQIAYTVSDDMSVTYGSDTFDLTGNAVDEEVDAFGVSYTSGGMTITGNIYEATGAANVSNAKTDKWALTAAFAF